MYKRQQVSSVAALGKSPDGSAVDENIKWLPADKHSPYSISKYFSETEVWRGAEEGLPVVIVNPSVILGPGDWQNGSCSILTIVDEGLSFYTTGITGYVDVRDVTKAMIQLMNSDISNERFLLNAENICYKDIFLSIAGKLGKKQKFREAKQWMMALAWRFEYLKYLITRIPPRVTKDIASAGLSRTFYSSSKFKKLLNFDFTPIDESIANMARCYRR